MEGNLVAVRLLLQVGQNIVLSVNIPSGVNLDY